MMISKDDKFVFVHIPRTGGWSVYAGLAALSSDGDRISGNKNHGHCHDTAETIKGWIGSEAFGSYFKFAFVRNPWDRELSQFIFNFIDKGKHAVTKACFRKWIMYRHDIVDRPIQKCMITYRSGDFAVDFVGRHERLQEDFNKVCGRLGFGTKQLPRANAKEHMPYMEYYDGDTVSMVGSYLRKDIEIFGYNFDGYDDKSAHIGFLKGVRP